MTATPELNGKIWQEAPERKEYNYLTANQLGLNI